MIIYLTPGADQHKALAHTREAVELAKRARKTTRRPKAKTKPASPACRASPTATTTRAHAPSRAARATVARLGATWEQKIAALQREGRTPREAVASAAERWPSLHRAYLLNATAEAERRLGRYVDPRMV